MSDYSLVKTIHMGAAALSIAGFVLRYLWMIGASPLLQARPAKILPHLVDTVLLASAITLAAMAGVAPWTTGWLGYKTVALIVYIVLGTVALKRGRARGTRIAAGAAAILVFASIVWVARFKSLPLIGVI